MIVPAKAIDGLLLAAIGGIAAADMFLAPVGVPFGFLFVTVIPFFADSPKLRRYVLQIGLICAAGALGGAAAKWTDATAAQVAQNRVLMLLGIGAVTHTSRRIVKLEDRTMDLEHRWEEKWRRVTVDRP